MQHKRMIAKRPLFVLFLLPTSFLAFSLLLFLACNGLLCLANYNRNGPLTPFRRPQPPHILLVLKQELQPAPFPPLSNFTTPPSREATIRRPSRRRLARFLLRPTLQPSRFSSRASRFFSSSPCYPHFFMTWISPLRSFGPRELLSVDALFSSHPNACLLIVSHTLDSVKGRRLLQPFVSNSFRVAALSPDYDDLFNCTPAAHWLDRLRSGEIQPGDVPIGQNLSNLLRLVLLYKHGGIYIDTDVVVMRSFSALRNTIGAQAMDARTGNWTRLNNAVMVFDKGHPLVYSFIEEFARSFDGSKWGHNGPYLVSRVARRTPRVEFTVLPPAAFYPVDWSRISELFRNGERGSKIISSSSSDAGSFALHLWNRQSRRLRVEAGSLVARIWKSKCNVMCNSSVVSALQL